MKRRYKKKIRAFMNCSQGPLIGTRDSFALSVLYDNFSALNSCDLQTELQSSIFSPRCPFSRKHQDMKNKTYIAFLHLLRTIFMQLLANLVSSASPKYFWFCGQWATKNFAFRSERRHKQKNLLVVWVLPFVGSLLCSIYNNISLLLN